MEEESENRKIVREIRAIIIQMNKNLENNAFTYMLTNTTECLTKLNNLEINNININKIKNLNQLNINKKEIESINKLINIIKKIEKLRTCYYDCGHEQLQYPKQEIFTLKDKREKVIKIILQIGKAIKNIEKINCIYNS